jgi:hypothetical protein
VRQRYHLPIVWALIQSNPQLLLAQTGKMVSYGWIDT